MNGTFSSANNNRPAGDKTSKIMLGFIVLLFLTVYISLEYQHVVQLGTGAKMVIFLLYYLLDLIYVVLSVTLILPFVTKPKTGLPYKLIAIVFWLTAAAIVTVLVMVIAYFIAGKDLSTRQILVAFLTSLYRHGYLSVYALLYFGAKLLLQRNKEREMDRKNLLLAKKQNAQLESHLLGVQMDAHLMVNILNTVQGDIMETAPQSSKLVCQLSEIQEHIMLRSDPLSVSTLADEVELLFHVIELYQEQGKTIGHFEFSILRELMDLPFPHNLIVPLIENLFKHGDFEDEFARPIVKISGRTDGLLINIHNKPNEIQYKKRRKLGMANLRKRLKYYFPGRFELQEGIKDGMYTLYLKIKLIDHD